MLPFDHLVTYILANHTVSHARCSCTSFLVLCIGDAAGPDALAFVSDTFINLPDTYFDQQGFLDQIVDFSQSTRVKNLEPITAFLEKRVLGIVVKKGAAAAAAAAAEATSKADEEAKATAAAAAAAANIASSPNGDKTPAKRADRRPPGMCCPIDDCI